MNKFRLSDWKLIPLTIFFLFLVLFLIFELTGILTLEDARDLVLSSGSLAGFVIFLLLIIDLVLPMPSSVLMTMAGSFYGLHGGFIIGVAGSVTASILGFFITRKIGSNSHVLNINEKKEMNMWFGKWGEGILIISRMIPIATETMACFAGLTKISFRKFLLLILVGTIPISLFYSYFGSISQSISDWALPLILGVLIPGIFWLVLKNFFKKESYKL